MGVVGTIRRRKEHAHGTPVRDGRDIPLPGDRRRPHARGDGRHLRRLDDGRRVLVRQAQGAHRQPAARRRPLPTPPRRGPVPVPPPGVDRGPRVRPRLPRAPHHLPRPGRPAGTGRGGRRDRLGAARPLTPPVGGLGHRGVEARPGRVRRQGPPRGDRRVVRSGDHDVALRPDRRCATGRARRPPRRAGPDRRRAAVLRNHVEAATGPRRRAPGEPDRRGRCRTWCAASSTTTRSTAPSP